MASTQTRLDQALCKCTDHESHKLLYIGQEWKFLLYRKQNPKSHQPSELLQFKLAGLQECNMQSDKHSTGLFEMSLLRPVSSQKTKMLL